jgi:hypothetical protein
MNRSASLAFVVALAGASVDHGVFSRLDYLKNIFRNAFDSQGIRASFENSLGGGWINRSLQAYYAGFRPLVPFRFPRLDTKANLFGGLLFYVDST